MIRRMFVATLLALSLPLVAIAAPTIHAGNHVLLPNTPNQTIQVLVSGASPADAFLGVDLYLTVGDGLSGPIITGVDVAGAGTVFDGNNFGQSSFGPPYDAPSREVVALTSTQNGFVGPNGILAFVTLDTTGVPAGDYTFGLTHSIFGPSDLPPFGAGDALLVDGTLSVVPEPSTVVLGLFALTGVGAAAIRRRRTTG